MTERPTFIDRVAGNGGAALISQSSPAATADAGADRNDWPDALPIDGGLPAVDAFSAELLPASFRPLAVDIAERMQVPIDYPAVALVNCLAGAVNRRARIQPKQQDTGWEVVPNLWGAIVAQPGFMKSPVIQAASAPLQDIQGEWRHEYDEARRDYDQVMEESDLKRAAWREQFKAHTKAGKPAPERPDHTPGEPRQRRLIVNDATFEALHQTMADNPAGILVIRDELTGWLSQLDRPGREGERAFCLQAWNGDTGHTIDRIGRGTIHVDACCLSILGGIQPARLRSYLVEALADGPANDGLIQRFQLLIWPETVPAWRYVDRPPDAAAIDQMRAVFRRLVSLDATNPVRFRFAPDAHELFVAFLTELEGQVRGGDLHPALVSHLAKYRSLMPSLALLFELADGAGDRRDTVSLEHARQAAAWCAYLESHARRVYCCVVSPQVRAARELADHLSQRHLGAAFSCRDVQRKGWGGLDTLDVVKLAVDVLMDAGWVREIVRGTGPAGGRPSVSYDVNPRVWR